MRLEIVQFAKNKYAVRRVRKFLFWEYHDYYYTPTKWLRLGHKEFNSCLNSLVTTENYFDEIEPYLLPVTVRTNQPEINASKLKKILGLK